MATLRRRLCYFALFVCWVFVSTKGEKWRAVVKSVRRCDDGPPLPFEYNTVKVTYSNNGNFSHFDGSFYISKNVTVEKAVADIYRSGNIGIKVFSYGIPDLCKSIMSHNMISDALFAPGAFPRTCNYQANRNYTFHMDLDFHGNLPGVIFRGPFIAAVKTFGDIGVVACNRYHVVVMKDTMN